MDTLYLCFMVAAILGLQTGSILALRCKYSREHKMMVANCYGLNFEDIPKNLHSDIEILYAETNRIRTLTNYSLSQYTSLKYIYLGDNFIDKIEPGAFADLDELEVLDLQKNGVRSMPTNLPITLRKLYLSKNRDPQNVSLSAAFNLNYLTLAECEIKTLPSLGVLPNLKELNLTGNNDLRNVTPADLAPLCRLEKLYLPQTLYKNGGSDAQCQCHRLLTWTMQRSIELPGYNCSSLVDPEIAECDLDLTEEVKAYKACLVAVPVTRTRYLLMAALAGAILLAALVLVCWWRKGRRKKNSVQDQKQKRIEKDTKVADTLIM